MRALALLLLAACAATTVLAQSAPEPLPTGDETSGASLFTGKGACQTCHRVQGKGSRLGPDLTDVGSTRTPAQLEKSLLDPAAEILPENRFYRVVTRDGASITGKLLNLDTFQVMMLDPKEQLRAFQKSDLREHGFVDGSKMPSYATTLSRQELADVIAYLATLKGVVAQ
ncbi:MAG: c-type cytochrome [Vicinamibacterales bacterium]|nr:c-type cytochrome [Vicinamibacterales bacterium]